MEVDGMAPWMNTKLSSTNRCFCTSMIPRSKRTFGSSFSTKQSAEHLGHQPQKLPVDFNTVYPTMIHYVHPQKDKRQSPACPKKHLIRDSALQATGLRKLPLLGDAIRSQHLVKEARLDRPAVPFPSVNSSRERGREGMKQ